MKMFRHPNVVTLWEVIDDPRSQKVGLRGKRPLHPHIDRRVLPAFTSGQKLSPSLLLPTVHISGLCRILASEWPRKCAARTFTLAFGASLATCHIDNIPVRAHVMSLAGDRTAGLHDSGVSDWRPAAQGRIHGRTYSGAQSRSLFYPGNMTAPVLLVASNPSKGSPVNSGATCLAGILLDTRKRTRKNNKR